MQEFKKLKENKIKKGALQREITERTAILTKRVAELSNEINQKATAREKLEEQAKLLTIEHQSLLQRKKAFEDAQKALDEPDENEMQIENDFSVARAPSPDLITMITDKNKLEEDAENLQKELKQESDEIQAEIQAKENQLDSLHKEIATLNKTISDLDEKKKDAINQLTHAGGIQNAASARASEEEEKAEPIDAMTICPQTVATNSEPNQNRVISTRATRSNTKLKAKYNKTLEECNTLVITLKTACENVQIEDIENTLNALDKILLGIRYGSTSALPSTIHHSSLPNNLWNIVVKYKENAAIANIFTTAFEKSFNDQQFAYHMSILRLFVYGLKEENKIIEFCKTHRLDQSICKALVKVWKQKQSSNTIDLLPSSSSSSCTSAKPQVNYAGNDNIDEKPNEHEESFNMAVSQQTTSTTNNEPGRYMIKQCINLVIQLEDFCKNVNLEAIESTLNALDKMLLEIMISNSSALPPIIYKSYLRSYLWDIVTTYKEDTAIGNIFTKVFKNCFYHPNFMGHLPILRLFLYGFKKVNEIIEFCNTHRLDESICRQLTQIWGEEQSYGDADKKNSRSAERSNLLPLPLSSLPSSSSVPSFPYTKLLVTHEKEDQIDGNETEIDISDYEGPSSPQRNDQVDEDENEIDINEYKESSSSQPTIRRMTSLPRPKSTKTKRRKIAVSECSEESSSSETDNENDTTATTTNTPDQNGIISTRATRPNTELTAKHNKTLEQCNTLVTTLKTACKDVQVKDIEDTLNALDKILLNIITGSPSALPPTIYKSSLRSDLRNVVVKYKKNTAIGNIFTTAFKKSFYHPNFMGHMSILRLFLYGFKEVKKIIKFCKTHRLDQSICKALVKAWRQKKRSNTFYEKKRQAAGVFNLLSSSSVSSSPLTKLLATHKKNDQIDESEIDISESEESSSPQPTISSTAQRRLRERYPTITSLPRPKSTKRRKIAVSESNEESSSSETDNENDTTATKTSKKSSFSPSSPVLFASPQLSRSKQGFSQSSNTVSHSQPNDSTPVTTARPQSKR